MPQRITENVATLLHWSEKYTKTDMVYLVKGSFWLTVGQGIHALTSFFLAIAFARFLSPTDYGTYKFVLAVFGMLSVATLSGMPQALTQAVARGYEGGLVRILLFRMHWGLLGTAGALLLSVYYFLQGNSMFAFYFVILASFVPLMESLTLYVSIWSGRKLFGISTLCASITHILSSLFLITALFFTHNIMLLLVVYCSSVSLMRACFHIATLRFASRNTEEDPATIKTGVHFSLMNIFPMIAQQIDKILLFHYLGAAEVAIYTFSVAIPDQLKSLLKGLQTIIIPKFAVQETEKIKKSIGEKMLPLVVTLTLVSVAYFFIAPYVYTLFFPTYLQSVPYSRLYGISIIALALILPHSLLHAKLATRELYRFNTVRAVVQIGFLFIGAYTAGIWGVITARVLSDFFNLGMLFVLSRGYREIASPEQQ